MSMYAYAAALLALTLPALLVAALDARVALPQRQAAAAAAPAWRPVVLMHGLNANKEAMSRVVEWITADFPGIYVLNAEVGNGKRDSLLMDMNEQVAEFAALVAGDAQLARGFNVIGHSQGGLLARGYLERYSGAGGHPPVHNLITWSTPHAGQYGVPELNAVCPDDDCPWLAEAFSLLVDGRWRELQRFVSFAAYWKDPLNMADYLRYSHFLADVNNERAAKNATYHARVSALNALVLEYSSIDKIVIPSSSPWFQFYAAGQQAKVTPLRQSAAYHGDWLGLRTLDVAGRLYLHETSCEHADYPRAVCKHYYDALTRPHLNNTLSSAN